MMILSPYILILMQLLTTTSMQLQLEDAPKKVGPLPKLTSDSKREEAIKLYGSGLLYEKENRLLDALRSFEKALELDPKNIDMRCDLATCYMNINKLKKSIKLLKENIAMNPKHEKSHHNLSVILKQNGDSRCRPPTYRINFWPQRDFKRFQPFVHSFVSFEILPLVEFQLEEGISDKEALLLIESSPKSYAGDKGTLSTNLC